MASHQNIGVNELHSSEVGHTITPASDVEASSAIEKIASVNQMNTEADDDASKPPETSRPDASAQAGVQKVQAITLSWTRVSLAALLCLIWMLFLVNGFRGAIMASLLPYVTSDWQLHSLLNVVGIVSSSMTAAVYIPMAKVLDVWGRAEGFLLMMSFSVVGLAIAAGSQNLPTFCAAQVFYSIGNSGVTYVICVLAADVTNLKNRGLAFAFTSSPYMITAFAGSKAAEGFLLNVNWRWGFGAFAIILPVVGVALFGVLRRAQTKALKNGLLVKEKNGRTILETVRWAIIQLDVLGVLLFSCGLTTFLLPFTLATSAPNGWRTDYIIAMVVVGFVLLAIFTLQQIYIAPVPFLNGRFLLDRTVVGACLINFTYQISYYCWNRYFTSFLQVVYNLPVAEAGYINSTFQVVSGVLAFIIGYAIRRTGRFKWVFYVAVPIYVFALGLMIHFRVPNGNIGYIIMCEIFISIGGSIFILCCQLAVLAAVDHQHIAASLAVLFVSGTIGGAVGSTVSGAIWTNTFPNALARNLPESALPNIAVIYGDITTQLSYAVGSPERYAIQESYGYAQVRMLAAGTGIMSLSFIWMFMIRNYNVAKMTQTRGVVF